MRQALMQFLDADIGPPLEVGDLGDLLREGRECLGDFLSLLRSDIIFELEQHDMTEHFRFVLGIGRRRGQMQGQPRGDSGERDGQ